MNFAAIDQTLNQIHKVDIELLGKSEQEDMVEYIRTGSRDTDFFVNEIMIPMNNQQGDQIPVSAFKGIEDGTFPTGTTQYEKRGIALEVPEWNADACLQCNQCSFVCPHSVLRPQLLTQEEWEAAPERIQKQAKKAKGYEGQYFYMGFSPLDCTGCGSCIQVCPSKPKALQMASLEKREKEEQENWNWITEHKKNHFPKKCTYSLKESQFLPSYFEFSGACAGCGETPYARLITQLFGDRMMISNSAGCATVWGGSSPAIPYKKDEKGHGPAWGFSLFEDNAEYGLGMYLGYQAVRDELKDQVEQLLEALIPEQPKQKELEKALRQWLEGFEKSEETRKRADILVEELEKDLNMPGVKEILERKDYLIKRSNWIFGGDGWAYDIGYGGLDHVLSTGADINVMVFDTEVYSNTGGQSSKSTPKAAIAKFSAGGKQRKKKELGMMAMQYGDVYVAQIAMGASLAQTLKAIQEAESYPGPSLIIGYAPCINHGIKVGMGRSQEQQKHAVETGYWNLYRYDPRRKEKGENPFILDSKEPKGGFREFLMSEVRFASLAKKNPDLAEELFMQAEEEAMERYQRYYKLSEGSR